MKDQRLDAQSELFNPRFHKRQLASDFLHFFLNRVMPIGKFLPRIDISRAIKE